MKKSFKLVKNILSGCFLIFLIGMLVLIIILNNKTYVLSKATTVLSTGKCSTVYYEPYKIFKYRADVGSNPMLTTDGRVLTDYETPGSEIFLSTDEENGSRYVAKITKDGYAGHGLSEEEYNFYLDLGISENQKNPTYIDYFIGNSDEDNKGIQKYSEDEILGTIKGCKE